MSETIEEKERVRAQAAYDANQAAKKAQLGKEGDFKKMVNTMLATNKAQTQQQTQQNDQKNRQDARLMARAGIRSHDLSGKLAKDGDSRNLAARRGRAEQEGSLQARRQALKGTPAPVKRPSGDAQQKSGNPPAKRQRLSESDSKKGKGSAEGRSVDQLLAAHSGIQMVHALGGVQATETAAAGASGAPTVQQMIDQIVKEVRKGYDPQGLGVIEITLADDVLAGAKLRLTSGGHGLDLAIFSDDARSSQLLGSGQTASELSKTLAQHKIRLNRLEVNHRKVLG